ncbi:MAG: PAS-domain containing protein [Pseudomonadota bacterium]
MEFWDVAIITVAAAMSAAVGVTWIASPRRTAAVLPLKDRGKHADVVSFLFEQEHLNHASENAQQLYRLIPGQDDWEAWRERMISRFPMLPEHPEDSAEGSQMVEARHLEDTAVLSLIRNGSFMQVHLIEGTETGDLGASANSALHRELAALRRASDTTPHAIWQVNQDGVVIWHNAAYERLYKTLHGTVPRADKQVFQPEHYQDGKSCRVSAQSDAGAHKNWFDVQSIRAGDISICQAMDVNAVVKSEVAQRNFVQTLAKTFAQLSIGLAIFDRNGQLALFNPALIDLTRLPADFLSGRPTVLSFFDRMRENRRMPEPKNYHSWRQEIAEVIAAATDDNYQETWTLETGQTYRVHGRPHPDGAIAFLIEDISAEVSLTRNFRAELELGQSLMDSFEEAIVVFSPTGILAFCNLAYRALWGIDPDSSFADISAADSTREWARQCDPSSDWARLTDFVLDYGDRDTWDMQVRLMDGTDMTCQVSRVASGATIVRFVKQLAKVTGRQRRPRAPQNR